MVRAVGCDELSVSARKGSVLSAAPSLVTTGKAGRKLGFSLWVSRDQARCAGRPSGQRAALGPATGSTRHPSVFFRLNVSIECKRVSGLEPATVAWAFDLTKTNMQTM